MSRRIARMSARMALRTRTVSRSRTSMFIGVSVGLKARLCSSARCRQLRPQNIGTHPWADFDFGFCTGGTTAQLQNPVLVAFRDQPNARSSG